MRQWPLCYNTVKANSVSPSQRYWNRWHCYTKYEQRRLAVLQKPIIWRTETEQLVPKCLLYKVQVCFRQWLMTNVTKVPSHPGVCRTGLKWKEGKYLLHLSFVFFFNYVLSIFVRFHRMAIYNSSKNAVDLHRSSPLPVTYTKVST